MVESKDNDVAAGARNCWWAHVANVIFGVWVNEHEVSAHASAQHLRHRHGDDVEEEQLITLAVEIFDGPLTAMLRGLHGINVSPLAPLSPIDTGP